MRMNKAVINRVYKYRWRKGITIADTDSSVYKFFKITYLLSLIWFLATDLLYILGSSLSFYDSVADNDALMLPFGLIVGATVCIIIATVLILKLKTYIIGSVLNLASFFVSGYEYYQLIVVLNMPNPIETTFWIRHGLPLLVLAFSCIVMCVIAVRAKILLRKDYKRVLEIIYENNLEKFENASAEEWDKILEELDDTEITEKFFTKK